MSGEVKFPRDRLVAVQQVLRIPVHYHIDRIKQLLQVTILIKRRPQVRHDDIPHEHYSFVGKINQHGVVGFTPSSRNQLELRPADGQVRSIVDRNVWLVTQKTLRAESLSEELFPKNSWPVGLLFELFLIVASIVKL